VAEGSEGKHVTLDLSLENALLKYNCPVCDHAMIKKGSWFRSVSKFRCPECKERVFLPYPEKIEIFRQYGLYPAAVEATGGTSS
jgi:predicted RNA-binding Zn-ribbon protein involved in translation (DUF1610 family)